MTRDQAEWLKSCISQAEFNGCISMQKEAELTELVERLYKLANPPYWQIYQYNPNGKTYRNETIADHIFVQCPEQYLDSVAENLDIEFGNRWDIHHPPTSEPLIEKTPIADYVHQFSWPEDERVIVYHFDGRKDIWDRQGNKFLLTQSDTHELFKD